MKNIHYLYLSRELHQQEHMYSCNKARKHCAKPRCFKYGCEIQEPSSALTRISLTPLSPAGALAVSQELWLRGIPSVPGSAAPAGHTAMPSV